MGERPEQHPPQPALEQRALVVAFDLGAHALDQAVVAHARWAGGDARHAAQAAVEMGHRLVGHRLVSAAGSPSGRSALAASQPRCPTARRWDRVQAEAAVDAASSSSGRGALTCRMLMPDSLRRRRPDRRPQQDQRNRSHRGSAPARGLSVLHGSRPSWIGGGASRRRTSPRILSARRGALRAPGRDLVAAEQPASRAPTADPHRRGRGARLQPARKGVPRRAPARAVGPRSGALAGPQVVVARDRVHGLQTGLRIRRGHAHAPPRGSSAG